jgi:N utilization substance protein B
VTRTDDRSDAREQAVSLLYEAEQRSVAATSLLAERGLVAEELTLALLTGVEGARDRIDAVIAAHARAWPLERMPAIDRAVLRLGVHELLSRPEVPVAVVIDEAVEIAKRFSTDDSGRFVNGVLAAVARDVRPDND